MTKRENPLLTSEDLDDIKSSGRDPAQVLYQLEILRQQQVSAPVLRPATISDGIVQLQAAELDLIYGYQAQAAAAGRISAFIPASGSGTRLLSSLLKLYRDRETQLDQIRLRASRGDDIAKDALVVLENIAQFAIWNELRQRASSSTSIEQILNTLFDDDSGLRYQELPKGLIPFHRYHDGSVRTAFAEQLNEAALLTTDRDKNCRIHFTVTPSHQLRFQEEWRRLQPVFEEVLEVRFQIDYSVQSSATDTIAVDLEGNIRRDKAGHILFQPGGHGALLENLASLGGDIVLIKNIDNIARQELSIEIVRIRKQICGLLLLVEHEVHDAIRGLRQGREPVEALRLIERRFGRLPLAPLVEEDARRKYAIEQLNRPLRVCGVVSTLDHAGGRPFWLDVEGFGPWLQIVEGAEVDLNNPRDRDLFYTSRHFNPVDIACSLRDADGVPFDLKRFTTPSRALIARKVLDGVPSLLYEHPGLWNGAMSLWNTVFVEIPNIAFNPVKSLSDLWAPGHREGAEVPGA